MSETHEKKRVNRRDLLRGVGAGLTAAVAGCSDLASGGNSIDDVPDFTVNESAQPTPMLLALRIVDTPDSIEFLDEFTVKLAVGNTGGAAIGDRTIDVAMKHMGGDDSRWLDRSVNEPEAVSAELPSIESGDWETVEVPLRVNAGGEWTVSADCPSHPEFDPRIDVSPSRLTPGDSISSEVGHFEITALEPRFEQALHYNTEEGGIGLFREDATGLLSAADDGIYMLHRFRVENTSSERSLGFGMGNADNQFSNAEIVGEHTGTVSAEDMRDDLSTLVVDEFGALFGDNAIAPGESVDLLYVQEVPAGSTETEISLSLWGNTKDILFDSVDELPSFPRFELAKASISDGDSSTPRIQATVRNIGDATGTFRGAAQFYYDRPTASNWVFLPGSMEVSIEPGKQKTVSVAASRGGEKFRILPFEAEVTP